MPNDEPPRRLLDGRGAFEDAARAVLLGLPASDCREAWLTGADLGDWPLGEPAVIAALAAWLKRPGRRLTLLALRFDGLARRHPRFAAWRIDHVHAIDSRSVADLDEDDMPQLLLAAPVCIRLHDSQRWRAVITQDARSAHLAAEQIAAISQRSGPAWPVRELGL
jgi:hypothetical protein